MVNNRVIPSLLIKNRELVKTRKFKNESYIGDPINVIRIFNEKEVDELIVIDINISKNNGIPDYEMIGLFADECFIPLCYGGGIRNIDQAARIFDLGVEKISIQSAAINDISFIESIAGRFGSQSLVLSVDVKCNIFGKYRLFESRKSRISNISLKSFVTHAVDLGAGEILINSVDRDGEMIGYDLKLIREISELVSVPVVALGGARDFNDFRSAIKAGASAVSAGSMFVFQGPHRAVLITYPEYKELQYLLYNNYE